MSGAGEKYDDGDKDLAPEVKRMKSSFEKTDIALIVDGKRLYINRNELMEKSPVFKKMLTADFKERNALKIELPKKDLHHFLMFLRCTLDGHDDQINNINVHCIIPIAHEYQVKETLDKANIFLSNKYLQRSLKDCLSTDIINGIIEAEKYGLTRTLKELIDRASRKKFKTFSKTSDFDAISKGTLNKISMARWHNDIDGNTGEPCLFTLATINSGVRN
ncbi:unnamed protein product [Mytilus edulis]|uniref:BTB domain-containing protein n=1 Tax=Mytilus edulis TaxID=6550 RepID=A0A8S3V018_MYTED|nr:unnamed protein product [Mytilus edulis]